MTRIARPSPNHDTRGGAGVDILVLHYTGMQTAEEALARLCDPAAKVSAHYTVDRDGTVYAHVPEEMRAWHAGVSYWAGARDINARSVGIEIVNPGHEFGYVPFPCDQIAAVIDLARAVIGRHAIPAKRVLGHSDVAPMRKQDPGELFPWKHLAEFGIGVWPTPAEPRGDFLDRLARYGYDPEAPPKDVVTAFQRHFRPSCVDGIADSECASLLAGLGAL
ncbi:MAG TPA: N-acetylmuramoyl-L-alanine amidase [Rhizomicrobium sp.]|nr:N-acetylmuramoyl-L-alanine amidase [Rhizomicrobium sp.]